LGKEINTSATIALKGSLKKMVTYLVKGAKASEGYFEVKSPTDLTRISSLTPYQLDEQQRAGKVFEFVSDPYEQQRVGELQEKKEITASGGRTSSESWDNYITRMGEEGKPVQLPKDEGQFLARKYETQIEAAHAMQLEPPTMRETEIFTRPLGEKTWTPRRELQGWVGQPTGGDTQQQGQLVTEYSIGGRPVSKKFAELYERKIPEIRKIYKEDERQAGLKAIRDQMKEVDPISFPMEVAHERGHIKTLKDIEEYRNKAWGWTEGELKLRSKILQPFKETIET
jgi:hypothetical protein